MIETIVISCLSVLTLLLLIDDIRLRIQKNNLANSLVEQTFDNIALQDELARSNNIPSDTEGFIKFLSESRESAYDYIEDVQAVISKLDTAMKSGNDGDIGKAYLELMTYMPETTNNN